MKSKQHIKAFVKKFSKRNVSLRDPQLMHPEREWVIGLVVSIVLFLMAASLSVYTYFKNQSVDVEVAADETTKVVYREGLVEEVLATIKYREATLETLKQDAPPVVEKDPIEEAATSTEDEILSESATTTTSEE